MSNLTAVILTKNEEGYLKDCLESLSWCDQVLVLDCFSTDRTVEIARQHGARIAVRPFVNFADQRNAAIEMVKTEWIFFVDADERVTPQLADEIRLAIENAEYDGWWIPRKNNLMGRWLEYGGFYPDYHLRLARTAKYRYDPQQIVHEAPLLDGQAGYLQHPLMHLWYQSLDDMLTTRAKYAAYMAEIHHKKGMRPVIHLVAAPVYVFLKQLLFLESYKDGRVGWLVSLAWGYYKFVEYWKVWGLRLAEDRRRVILHDTD